MVGRPLQWGETSRSYSIPHFPRPHGTSHTQSQVEQPHCPPKYMYITLCYKLFTESICMYVHSTHHLDHHHLGTSLMTGISNFSRPLLTSSQMYCVPPARFLDPPPPPPLAADADLPKEIDRV